jgi:hypothetical protein
VIDQELDMRYRRCRRTTGAALVAALAAIAGAATPAAQVPETRAAALAAEASPALVDSLSKELGANREQAAGAAGALFGVAKSRLKPGEFTQVSNAVPGMAQLLNAAPAADAVGTSGIASLAKSAGGLAGAASAFSKLGLKPELVAKAVPVLVSFVSKSGGSNVGSLLAGVLK